jgi:RNA polymerase subunit RPABC4/transcription elongation factor Spt4
MSKTERDNKCKWCGKIAEKDSDYCPEHNEFLRKVAP